VGSPDGDFGDVAVWVFLVHPASMSFLAFLLISLFLTAIDENQPWRPLHNYIHIPVLVYISQVRTHLILLLSFFNCAA
jgi:hypothetical protein